MRERTHLADAIAAFRAMERELDDALTLAELGEAEGDNASVDEAQRTPRQRADDGVVPTAQQRRGVEHAHVTVRPAGSRGASGEGVVRSRGALYPSGWHPIRTQRCLSGARRG